MKEKFLPIGSVVMLNDGSKEVMITSYLVVSAGRGVNNDRVIEPTNEMFDYGGCPFPEGVIDSNLVLAFNHSQISEVIHIGCQNESQKKFGKVLLEKENEIRELHKSGKLYNNDKEKTEN